MSDLLIADFSNARVGDRVKCLGLYEYIVFRIKDNGTYPVILKDEENHDIVSCTFEGFAKIDNNAPFYFYHFEGQFPSKEACTRPLPEIEIDTKVLVCPLKTKRWVKYYATGKICELGYMQVFSMGRTEWSNNGLMGGTDSFKYWKLADDPTINSGNLEELENE